MSLTKLSEKTKSKTPLCNSFFLLAQLASRQQLITYRIGLRDHNINSPNCSQYIYFDEVVRIRGFTRTVRK